MKLEPQNATKPTHRAGLAHWMHRVLHECDRVAQDFSADPVHDLRVALRRCRSLADGLMTVDPHPDWRAMRKAGRRLFRRLGELRDLHVTREWIEKLSPADDPVHARLIPLLVNQESQLKEEARAALASLDRKQWKQWARTLPARARWLPADGPAFEHIALERWYEAYELHRRGMRNRSQVGWHRLRVGLKRFRYTVENFLPSRGAWLRDLKRLQDLLGEVHDLDVLAGKYFTRSRMFDDASRTLWRERIRKERELRLAEYRSRMAGRDGLWWEWRPGLPDGERLRAAGLAKLRAWASFTDPRFQHSLRVTRLALELFDGLARLGVVPRRAAAQQRRILHAAALLHNIGLARGGKGHHKATYKMIRGFPVPLGWTAPEMKQTALVARYHRGAEPRQTHRGFGELPPAARRSVTWLAGLLRLADGLAQRQAGPVRAVRVEKGPEAIDVWARGYRENQRTAALMGGRKHLLETLLGQPLIVRGLKPRPAKARRRRRTARPVPARAIPTR